MRSVSVSLVLLLLLRSTCCMLHVFMCGYVSGLHALCTVCVHLQDIKFNVHAHPTLSEVLDELFKQAHIEAPAAKPAAKQPVAA